MTRLASPAVEHDRLSELSDAQLVVAVGRFREDALAEIYSRHGGAIFGLARRVTGSQAEAEDVTQEVILRLWNEPDRFDPDRGALRSFLLAQAHGRAVDIVRSRMARLEREVRDARRTPEAGYDLEREILERAVAGQVSEALSSLPENERRPIELAYYEGHTYREVAYLLSQPEGTVKSRIRAGLRRMSQALSEIGVRGTEP